MLHIFGKTLPVKKKIVYSLISLFGINYNTSKQICQKVGINPSVRIDYLKKNKLNKLVQYIDQNLIIEKHLKKLLILNKQQLVNMKSTRGLRNLKGLPVRGQRTHTNRKTSRKIKNRI